LDSLRDRRSKAYIRAQFVILYGTLFAFLIAIIAGMSYKLIRTMEVETAEKGKILVEQTRDLIDVHLTQIDRMLTRFERSPVFRAFLIMPSYRKSSPELSIVIDAFNELKEYRLQNDFIRSVFFKKWHSDLIRKHLSRFSSRISIYSRLWSLQISGI